MYNKINALSLFSKMGIGEMYLNEIGIDVVVASEHDNKKADVYKTLYPKSIMINGDINDVNIKNKIIEHSKNLNVELIIGELPIYRISKVKKIDENLIYIDNIIEIIKMIEPKYIFLQLKRYITVDIKKYLNRLLEFLDDTYNIEEHIINYSELGIALSKEVCILKIYKKDCKWDEVENVKEYKTVQAAIGKLPSLDIEYSKIRNYKLEHLMSERYIETNIGECTYKLNMEIRESLKKTPSGEAVNLPEIYLPRLRGRYPRRIKWDVQAPCNCLNDEIRRSYHPGRYKSEGIWSDPRRLTLREKLELLGAYENKNINDILVDLVKKDDRRLRTLERNLSLESSPIAIRKILEKIKYNKKIDNSLVDKILTYGSNTATISEYKNEINMKYINNYLETEINSYINSYRNKTLVLSSNEIFEWITRKIKLNNENDKYGQIEVKKLGGKSIKYYPYEKEHKWLECEDGKDYILKVCEEIYDKNKYSFNIKRILSYGVISGHKRKESDKIYKLMYDISKNNEDIIPWSIEDVEIKLNEKYNRTLKDILMDLSDSHIETEFAKKWIEKFYCNNKNPALIPQISGESLDICEGPKQFRCNSYKKEDKIYYTFDENKNTKKKNIRFDFAIINYNKQYKVIIELDGNFHNDSRTRGNDNVKSSVIQRNGWIIKRYTGNQIKDELEYIFNEMKDILEYE